MAWTTPRTWADGELPTAAQFNAHFRDNLNELALHAHGGGSGSGTNTLGPINGVTYRNIAAPGGAGGTYVRTFATNGTVGWVEPGGGAFLAANATHEHTLSIGSNIAGSSVMTGTTITNIPFTAAAPLSTAGYTSTFRTGWSSATATITIGGTGRFVAVVVAQSVYLGTTAAAAPTGTGSFRLVEQRDGTGSSIISTWQMTAHPTARAFVSTTQIKGSVLPSGSYRYYVEARASAQVNNTGVHLMVPHVAVVESRYTGG